ncbi:hypothetical protein CAEBREN_19250 [Caenorhabditis brenneri]|uniref:Uncharacterized protein n=1 Tax=Caenorhabditis brenneri TaxID=135651 RepID=G0N2A9_CAEBE|nr:hypothetical protein CAEBREN_19250 [Caenorhabditis brenneri]
MDAIEMPTAPRNTKLESSTETSGATLTNVNESSKGAAALEGERCKSEISTSSEDLKTALQNQKFGRDAETLEAVTETMLEDSNDFMQALCNEQSSSSAVETTECESEGGGLPNEQNVDPMVKEEKGKTEVPLFGREKVNAFNAALHNRRSELSPGTVGPSKVADITKPEQGPSNEQAAKDKKPSKNLTPASLKRMINLLKEFPAKPPAVKATSGSEMHSSESPEVDSSEFEDALDGIFFEMGGNENLSILGKKKRKIMEQRKRMREVKANDGGRMTLENWRKENKKLDELVRDLYLYLDNVLARFQVDEQEALHAQSRVPNGSNATSFNSYGLVAKEKVLLQLLVTQLPDPNLGLFIEDHFDMEEFKNFKLKLMARHKMIQEHTLKLPEPSAPNGEKDHRMVTKRAYMDDIALRIKQWKREFEMVLLPIAAWPVGVPRMYFTNKEKELIGSIASGLSPLFESIQEEALTLFSFSELEDLSYKVDYRIDVMIDAQIQKNLFSEKAPGEQTTENKPMEPEKNRFGCEDWEIEDRDKLIPEMSMFLLQPEISDLLTVEEKFAIVHYRMYNHGGPKTLQFATLSWLRNVHSKLDGLEVRLKEEMDEKNSKFWFPKSSRELSRRDDEDRLLLDSLLFMIIRKFYDRSDPLKREEFNDDFRFVFSNRKLMFDYRQTMQGSYPIRMNPVNMDIFTERFCTPNESHVEKMRGLPYEEVVMRTVMANRWRRKQHEMALNEEEQDPVKRAGRMREESEQLRLKEEHEEEKVMQQFLRPFPPLPYNFFKSDDFLQLVVYTNDMKLPKRFTEQSGPRIRRKINKDDPIRVARREWRSHHSNPK